MHMMQYHRGFGLGLVHGAMQLINLQMQIQTGLVRMHLSLLLAGYKWQTFGYEYDIWFMDRRIIAYEMGTQTS
jgi:hypothetical protein